MTLFKKEKHCFNASDFDENFQPKEGTILNQMQLAYLKKTEELDLANKVISYSDIGEITDYMKAQVKKNNLDDELSKIYVYPILKTLIYKLEN